MDIIRKILGLPPKQTEMYSVLNESVNEKIKKVLLENETLKAQIGKRNLEDRKKSEEEKSTDEEQKIIKDLNEQQKNINQERFGDVVFLSKFYKELIENPIFKRNLEVCDKDDSLPGGFGKFGDFAISTKTGELLILDQYFNPISWGKNIGNVIFKPETLGNQIKRKRILIPRTKENIPIPDFENLEMNDIVYEGEEIQVNPADGKKYSVPKISETLEYRDKVINLLIKREKEIREKSNTIERYELAQIAQKKKLDEQERELKTFRAIFDSTNAEHSNALDIGLQVISKMGDVQKRVVNLSELKAIYEGEVTIYKQAIDKLHERIAHSSDKTLIEETEEKIFNNLERAKSLLPEKIIENIQPEKEPIKQPNPGEVLGARISEK